MWHCQRDKKYLQLDWAVPVPQEIVDRAIRFISALQKLCQDQDIYLEEDSEQIFLGAYIKDRYTLIFHPGFNCGAALMHYNTECARLQEGPNE